MLTTSINFSNFNNKKNNNKIKKNLSNLIKENIPILKSLSKKYEDNFDKNFLKKMKKFQNYRLLGMGGSTLGSQAIYQFLGKKIKKKFEFVDNLQPIKRKRWKGQIAYSKSGGRWKRAIKKNH